MSTAANPYAAIAVPLAPQKRSVPAPPTTRATRTTRTPTASPAAQRPNADPYADMAVPLSPSSVSPAAPDLTTNTINPATGTGYGLYAMSGPDGTRQIPFNKVPEAQRQGYTMGYATQSKYHDDFQATQPSWFQRVTEPSVPQLSPDTTPTSSTWAANRDAAWNAGMNALKLGGTAAGNILKRAARTAAGAVEFPVEIAGLLKRLSSPNLAVSEQAETELLNMHPATAAYNRVREAVRDWRKSPSLAMENALGDALGMALASEATEGSAKVIDTAKVTAEELPENVRASMKRMAGIDTLDVEKEAQKVADENKKLVDKSKARAQEIRIQEASEAAKQQKIRQDAIDAAEQKRAENQRKADETTDAAQKVYFQKHAEHQQAVAQVEQENARLEAEYHKAVADYKILQDSLNTSDRTGKSALKALDKSLHAKAHALYTELDEQLADKEVDNVDMTNLADHIATQIDPAVGMPPIFKKFNDYIGKGAQVLKYSDLESFRSLLAKDMRRGNLGRAYPIYDMMLNGDPDNDVVGIIPEMDKIAGMHDLADQANAARAAWREWTHDFVNRDSPFTKIVRNPESHGLLANLRAHQTYVDGLRRFGPEGEALASQIETSLNLMKEKAATKDIYGGIKLPKPKRPTLANTPEFKVAEPAVTIPESVPPPKTAPLQLTAGPAEQRAAEETLKRTDRVPVGPDFEAELRRTISPEEWRARQHEQIKELGKQRSHPRVRSGLGGILSHQGLTVWALAEMLRGRWAYGTALMAARVLVSLDEKWIGKVLQNERVSAWLSHPTKSELEVMRKMTPEQKAVFGEGLDKLLSVAQKKGMRVNPIWPVMAATAAGANASQQPNSSQPSNEEQPQ